MLNSADNHMVKGQGKTATLMTQICSQLIVKTQEGRATPPNFALVYLLPFSHFIEILSEFQYFGIGR